MKVFKRAVLVAGLALAGFGAASTAQAATQVDATGAFTATAGTMSFASFSCSSGTATGNLATALETGDLLPIALSFNGCTQGVITPTVTCDKAYLRVDGFSGSDALVSLLVFDGSDADAAACVLDVGGVCTFSVTSPYDTATAHGTGYLTLDPANDELTVPALSLPGVASSALTCALVGVPSSVVSWSGAVYAQTAGTSWSTS